MRVLLLVVFLLATLPGARTTYAQSPMNLTDALELSNGALHVDDLELRTIHLDDCRSSSRGRPLDGQLADVFNPNQLVLLGECYALTQHRVNDPFSLNYESSAVTPNRLDRQRHRVLRVYAYPPELLGSDLGSGHVGLDDYAANEGTLWPVYVILVMTPSDNTGSFGHAIQWLAADSCDQSLDNMLCQALDLATNRLHPHSAGAMDSVFYLETW